MVTLSIIILVLLVLGFALVILKARRTDKRLEELEKSVTALNAMYDGLESNDSTLFADLGTLNTNFEQWKKLIGDMNKPATTAVKKKGENKESKVKP